MNDACAIAENGRAAHDEWDAVVAAMTPADRRKCARRARALAAAAKHAASPCALGNLLMLSALYGALAEAKPAAS